MRRPATVAGWLVTLTIAVPAGVRAQGLSAEVAAGRLVHEALSATPRTNHLMGTLRYDTSREAWVYGSAVAPLGDATFWGGAGTGTRLLAKLFSGTSLGADVAGHGYLFRDPVVDADGSGWIGEATPFVRVAGSVAFAEGYGGWRGHTMTLAGVRDSRRVFETGARGGYHAKLLIEADAKWVHAPEGKFPFIGARAAYHGRGWQIWGDGGRWMHDDLTAASWGAGFALPVSGRSTVWASMRQEPPDPLYWNTTRRAWTVGLSQRLGRLPSSRQPVAAMGPAGVSIRVRATDVPAGEVAVAGDFNNWQAVPMRREGDYWLVDLRLAPGIYHYAFRSAGGTWFVPPSTPGRRDDGMGGHVAVLLVS